MNVSLSEDSSLITDGYADYPVSFCEINYQFSQNLKLNLKFNCIKFSSLLAKNQLSNLKIAPTPASATLFRRPSQQLALSQS